jgi:hypothetical protein
VNVITTHDAASKNRNRVTRIANSQISIIRELIEWSNDRHHPARARKATIGKRPIACSACMTLFCPVLVYRKARKEADKIPMELNDVGRSKISSSVCGGIANCAHCINKLHDYFVVNVSFV